MNIVDMLEELEELIEDSYWRFDARRKGYGQWKGMPMSERDAFKAEMRLLVKIMTTTYGVNHN